MGLGSPAWRWREPTAAMYTSMVHGESVLLRSAAKYAIVALLAGKGCTL